MVLPRIYSLLIIALCTGTAQAAMTGNDPSDPTPLAPGQVVINGELTGAASNLDTLLGHFTPGFLGLNAVDDNSSNLGGEFASGLFGLSLEADGSIFVGLTGVGNDSFVVTNSDPHSHDQSGSYQIVFDFYDSFGAPLETYVYPGENSTDSIEPGAVETIFVPGTPERIGGSVDVNVNTLVGSGAGNSIDFWLFNGLTPGAPFEAVISLGEFESGIGVYSDIGGSLLDFDIDSGANGLSLITGVVPVNGQVVIGVTGAEDASQDGFIGDHSQEGSYTLALNIVPEPSTLLLLFVGLVIGAISRRRK